MPSVLLEGHPLSGGHAALERRAVPKLDGSAPAFIALLVVLVLVIVISGAGILYVLWDNRHKKHRPSRVRRYESTGIDVSAQDRRWTARLGRIFGSQKPGEPTHRKEPTEKETVQVWAKSVHNAHSTRDILATIREEQPEHQPGDGFSVTDQTSTSPRSLAISLLDASRPQRPVLPRNRTYAPSYISEGSIRSMSVVSYYPTRQESSGPQPQPSIPSIVEHLTPHILPPSSPSLAPSPLGQRTESSQDHNEADYPNGRGRPFATQSGTSITLEGGTKFLEEL